MPDNPKFFRDNVAYYSDDYRDFSFKPWEKQIVDSVKGPEVLDVACGGGRMAVPLLRMGHNVTCVDFIHEFEGKIRRHGAEFRGTFKFAEAQMTKLPFADNTFDSVICINSVLYLTDLHEVQAAVNEMCRVLKPGGKLFITSWSLLQPLWFASVVLNYVTRRSKTFGETHPFFTMDGRLLNKSKTHMFIPARRAIERMCNARGVNSRTYTGYGFTHNGSPMAPLHPILVIEGTKRESK